MLFLAGGWLCNGDMIGVVGMICGRGGSGPVKYGFPYDRLGWEEQNKTVHTCKIVDFNIDLNCHAVPETHTNT